MEDFAVIKVVYLNGLLNSKIYGCNNECDSFLSEIFGIQYVMFEIPV